MLLKLKERCNNALKIASLETDYRVYLLVLDENMSLYDVTSRHQLVPATKQSSIMLLHLCVAHMALSLI